MDLLAKTRELLESLADATESGSKFARYRIEIANLDRKLGLAFRRLGERAFQLETEGRTEVFADAGVQAAIEELRRIRARMEVIRQEAERQRGRAKGQVDRAARLVRAQADRAATAIRDESTKAATAVRGAVSSRKRPAKKRKETTDLQP